MVEQHEGEQTLDLGEVHQRSELPREPDRLGGEVDVARVALVEDEVEHAHHGARVARVLEASSPDRALGAADALRHGALGHEVGLCDLTGRETAHGAEGQRDRR